MNQVTKKNNDEFPINSENENGVNNFLNEQINDDMKILIEDKKYKETERRHLGFGLVFGSLLGLLVLGRVILSIMNSILLH
ncbi:hypothetical protein H9L19_00105 [Weissella diestrammenae]|uniref:Uncharacterized protein n=1 Tax=Weissella diestrammenae TaxID=1162633 RepID=A0A7G9T5H3_9LACO|nr:hypothetical protein [Weissella diestrammenae]MCM0583209.1 hypothetical protein [Weissella diestrammenae]QNN75348.1 hypothetical protein H9L19_00105 [Weissella diestrammenae]